MIPITTLVRELWRDRSLTRIFLNERLSKEPLSGNVLDVGCGSNSAYLDFMSRTAGMQMHIFDPKVGKAVDFEKDVFPHTADAFDMVVVLNVLEHVFHYDHLLNEMRRVLKPGGRLVGFTPFLVRYHPDPHDFFRYTDEALLKILSAHEFENIRIEPVGAGPFMAALNIFILSIPRPVRILCALIALPLDALFIRVRPHARGIYPMGYYFIATK